MGVFLNPQLKFAYMASNIKKTSSILFYLSLVVGVLFLLFIPSFFVLGFQYWEELFWSETALNSTLSNIIAFSFVSIIFRRFENFPQKNPLEFILPIALSIFALLISVLLILRLNYSIKIIIFGFLLTTILLAIQHFIISRALNMTLFIVPLGEALSFQDTRHYTFKKLTNSSSIFENIDGVVADMHSNILTPDWQKFLSICALKGIPVYNSMQLKEALTGKVNVSHLIANNFGDLSPSPFYLALKRLIDLTFLILIAPIVIPLMILIAIWIVSDNPGMVFFVQTRIGLGGKRFNLVKFRSMFIGSHGSYYTEDEEDPRITRVGKIIRKYRLDELPQFWNVIKGDMSLIGPRPESLELAKKYEKKVPFFSYRHVLRPGISGWAQVMQGYTSSLNDARDKLAYDFYYIKHFSLWLDLLVCYKTIKTIFTGFGSR